MDPFLILGIATSVLIITFVAFILLWDEDEGKK